MKKIVWMLVLVASGVHVRGEMIGGPEESGALLPPSPSTATDSISTAVAPGTSVRLPLKIVHPPAGAAIPPVKSSFVFGWADPKGRLTVNGRSVPIHAGGGWLTVLPYPTGPFTIQADLQLSTSTYTAVRYVTVGGGASASSPALTATHPDQDLLFPAGETVVVQAHGLSGMEASFQWTGSRKKISMSEIPGNGRSVYRAFFVIPSDPDYSNAALKITLKEKKGGDKISVESPGRVARLDRSSPWVVEVSTDLAILRAGPGGGNGDKGGYLLFPSVGTRLLVTGRRGKELRVALTATREAWIGVDEVKDLPDTTPVPRAAVTSASVELSGRHTLVRVYGGTKVPFEVRPSDDGRTIDVLFYGAVSDTDWIHYRGAGGAVRRLEWFQDDSDTYRLRAHLFPGRWWGYDARYEANGFALELRRPLANQRDPSSLAGLKVALDAGHSPDSGAVGPTELAEKDANRAISECLEKKLKREGAEVYMVRKGTENVTLYDRPKRAWAAKADVLISVHNNALPEGADPFERNGYGVYYFQPHSFALADRIHKAYGEIFERGRNARRPPSSATLRNDGLHYGNLALPRTTQMPSVLTESAYMIRPEEEALLKTERFQCDCADAMVLGLKHYVRDIRRLDTLP
jgi:N-acetylmuramoyl-L-alanine amidase